VFVHNATDGLPPHVHELLLNFEAANPSIKIEPWCMEELRLIFRKLSDDDKAAWFGAALTEETSIRLGFADLQVVLETIEALPAPQMTEVTDVPAGKIEANALSEAVTHMIRQGLVKSYLVADFFTQWHDETLGERLAEAFKAEYRRLRGVYAPNRIFAELQSWAGGDHRGSPEHELAVLTVIAYYFERCDIFEEPRGAAK
jgi:hypothetical protein